MENYIVSARKYRPVTFDTVVGQHSITSTLKNAIKTAHLAQAFLFCGPRGVGKTTCARILAKTINCFNITQNIEACDECESCKSFNEGHSLNVYELDAASNNSVDDIRALIDQVRFAPQLGTHKVYIIDEVHMLSQAAFNAFLKTLEEPPKHAIFILATTEKHKIIPTILSRCQVFDFNRIQIEDIANHLAHIAEQETIEAEKEGLHIIAQKADGALRDALSMFDQIVSFSGNKITYQDVIDNLNILDYDYYFKITDAIITNDISNALLIFNEILNNGFDGHNFINGLSEHLRNLLVCQDNATVNLLEVGPSIKEKYLEQSKKINLNDLISFLSITSQTDTTYKSSKNKRLLVEVMLMQLCSRNYSQDEKKKPIINLPFSNNKELAKAVEKHEGVVVQPKKEHPQPTPTVVNEPVISLNKPETPAVEEKKVTYNQPLSSFQLSGTISIKEQLAEKENSGKKEDSSEKPTAPFTEEAFLAQWKIYKDNLLSDGQIMFASAFENAPEIEGTLIKVIVENKAIVDEFTAQKPDILDFFRATLNNYSIDFELTINKDKANKKAFTPEEKFEKMSEKNPVLKLLKDRLDLEVGY
ncbi:MAG: DNA polymerase III subunit gamma/tau [Flavobacteriales bacterium]|nr:DNA polymerase III subunit gamma/tau [Flavobacteriales bacterium]|tara:strand:- start:53232 stop:54998 length:1767 start_codon:yes stop_codon:yes gene_type:complete